VGSPPARHATGDQPLIPPRRGTGEQPPVPPRWSPTEQPPPGPPPPRHATGEQPVVERLGRRTGELGRRTAELRRQAGRAPVVALALAAFVLLAALPAVFFARDASADPVFAGLDELNLPAWATQARQDASTGSRWCVQTCRLRERTWRSAKPAPATDTVYQQALTAAGWRPWHTPGCPVPASGVYTCWQRDKYVLDLWTRDAACDLAGVAPAPAGPARSGAPVPDPSAGIPSPGASEPPPTCDGSLVSAKATERYNRDWHH
jgi:hypothetical protein